MTSAPPSPPSVSLHAKPAILLLSGGLDSATTLAYMLQEGFAPYAISFAYGQRHQGELIYAKQLADQYGIEFHQFHIDLSPFHTSSLINSQLAVPDSGREDHDHAPSTYVPARNTIFLSYALGMAEVIGAYDIFIGANAVDYSGYPDCRPAYLSAFEQLAKLATVAGTELGKDFTIHAPLLHLSKKEIIEKGIALGLDYGLTRSCYQLNGKGEQCGHCDSCHYRLEGFREAGIQDPAPYVAD